MVKAHIDEIINLTSVKGSNYGHFQEFYKKVSKNIVALQTLGESDRLHGFVMPGLRLTSCCRSNQSGESWENWDDQSME